MKINRWFLWIACILLLLCGSFSIGFGISQRDPSCSADCVSTNIQLATEIFNTLGFPDYLLNPSETAVAKASTATYFAVQTNFPATPTP